jgi:TonB dependent receptor-like, beta-barrel/Carboxypeptidase regulatory-like domain
LFIDASPLFRVNRAAGCLCMLALAAGPVTAQTGGAISGRVHDAVSGASVAGATVSVDGGRQGAGTDTGGFYRVREVRSGWHHVQVARIGYRPVVFDSVLVRSGETVVLNVALQSIALEVESIAVSVTPDRVLDPMVPQDLQRITGDEIRRLPVTSLEEAVALSAGAVGESYRGGRLGEQAFVLDGIGVKNQLDASTGSLGIRIPPDILTEASLVTNTFSARYGQAISGLVNVVTKDPGEYWHGRVAYENDRPLPQAWDYGIDRLVVSASGPITHHIGIVGVFDAQGRLDADPVNAPAPGNPHDPRHANPYLLPHNSGERYDAGLKLIAPLGERQTVRLFGLQSYEQRFLFDPAFKYDPADAPAQRVDGTLLTGQIQHTSAPGSLNPLTADLRVAYFDRQFERGTLDNPPRERFGAFTFSPFHFLGEGLARAQDTIATRNAVPGFDQPDLSDRTPWGVPAFFLGSGSRGDIAWNRFRELRAKLDVTLGSGRDADFYFGAEVARQHVQTFQRVLAYLPVDSTVPPPTASDFSPISASAYAETQLRVEDLAFTMGLRYDQFDGRVPVALGGARYGAQRSINPRFAVSTVLQGATFVASWGRFSQPPDFQYLVDAAFDDTTRTGRFRRGNPALGFEDATQYEFSLRLRPTSITSVRTNVYIKRLGGLVASVPLGFDPDSSIFGNADFGTVKGAEIILEKDATHGWGVRVAYTFQTATATATNAFQLLRRIRLDSLGDTINPARVEFPLDYDRRHSITIIAQSRINDEAGPHLLGQFPLGGLETAAIFHYGTGLPYSRTNTAGDTLIGLPNSYRLPSEFSLDALVRRPIRLWGMDGGLYLDARNLLNRRNLIAVRRDTGEPGLTDPTLQSLAQAAYQAHPEAIPYESPRYRPWADTDGNGLIEGAGELMPLYLAAARDFAQPLFVYGAPRLVRLGMELTF